MTLTITAHGASYRVDDPGGIIGQALRDGCPYEHKVLEHIYRREFRGRAVDVGAGIGNHSLWFAAVCGLRVSAFEPLDHARLLRNVELNPELPIGVFAFALGDRTRDGIVTPPPAHVVGRALTESDEVPIHTLDSAEYDDVAVIKIDVEGMEPQVLRGAKDTIDRCHPVLYVEAQSKAAARRNLEEIPRGYVYTRTFGATPLTEWQWQG